MKVCIVAPPSCDKTTVAREVVKVLKKEHKINAEVCEEYAREYIVQNHNGFTHPFGDTMSTPFQQYPIFVGQSKKEGRLSLLHDIVVCDSASFLGCIYVDKWLDDIKSKNIDEPLPLILCNLSKEFYSIAVDQLELYDLIFLFHPTGEVFQDGVRIENKTDQFVLAKRIKGFLDFKDVNYISVEGTIPEKTDLVVSEILKHFKKL